MSAQMSFLTLSPATLTAARRKARAGAQRAVRHADAAVPAWSEAAAVFVLNYARQVNAPFLVEDAREAWHAAGYPAAAEPRAWGSVVRQLGERGQLVAAGYLPARSSHGSPKTAWRLAR